ncbi:MULTISPECIES: RnfABCDGE type electron transport complex subunit D [Flavobacterium]|uniref:RnfABCDGE type electron transport complex subunit D n=1 Tax=Flavobacterium TaxID=237 RepID=UPI0011839B53|nr:MULTISPECIES: RnfABCDGE type electron transport complex subunit D [Flavobacterium]MCR4031444.1 RnfABCDGE type electron transport complex subunit D [Flavobacterium panacis]
MKTAPFIKPKFNGTQMVMLDVVIALMPLVIIACFAYGKLVIMQFITAIMAAFVSEFIFSSLLLKKYNTLFDGSALVTALLLVLTLSPLVPLHIVAFGAVGAILFGKILWGGLGKNTFNPALVGREFMSVFFSSIMTSSDLWKTKGLVKTTPEQLFLTSDHSVLSEHLNSIVYKTSGAVGEYSILFIVLGGFYLLMRSRISWHIPFALLAVFTLLLWLPGGAQLHYSAAGILLGTIFMATDMPSSPATPNGKLYYGMMTGLVIYILIKGGVKFEYMSYSILLLNAFSHQISILFRPSAWGDPTDWKQRVEPVFNLTVKILLAAFAMLSLYYYGLIHYVVFVYILYLITKFNFSFTKKINNAI